MRHVFLTAFLLLLFSQVVLSQSKGSVSLPDTAAGRLLAAWLGVHATGNQVEYKNFIAEHYSEALLKEDTAHDRADRQARVYLDTRGFYVRTMEKSAPDEIVVLAQAALTDLWFGLTLKVDAANKISQYSSQRILPPAGHEVELTERELVRDVGAFLKKLADVDAFSGVVLIAKDGRVVFKQAYGLASKAYNIPNR